MSTRAATGLIDRRRAVLIARHRRRRTGLLTVVAGSAAVAGVWWLGNGPVLSLTSVEISGYRQPDQAEVMRAIQIASRDGTMLRLPTVAVREALARHPWVERVSVHHTWPRGMDVTIVEATPAAIAITSDGHRFLVSTSGRVLGATSVTPALPTYRVPSLEVGAWLRGPAQRGPFQVVTAMSPATGRRVHDLRLEHGVIVGRLDAGTDLVLGPPRQLWAKGRAVEAVLADRAIAKRLATARYLDVSSPRQPTLGGIPSNTEPAPSTEGQPLPTG